MKFGRMKQIMCSTLLAYSVVTLSLFGIIKESEDGSGSGSHSDFMRSANMAMQQCIDLTTQ